MNAQHGYSGKPSAEKLGLKDGQAVAFVGLPAAQQPLAASRDFLSVAAADDWRMLEGDHFDVVMIFTDSADEVGGALKALRTLIRPDGMIWVAWPKRTSGVATDVTEDVIRRIALADVLVDVKVCAIDDTWSGLKLVIRKENRP